MEDVLPQLADAGAYVNVRYATRSRFSFWLLNFVN
jgi:hypothetical protein